MKESEPHAAPPAGVLDRVFTLLERQPLPTAELAQHALGVRGDPRACARIVWSVLGSDPRFAVSPSGVWSLAPVAAAGSLRNEDWVVVDVETTGGTPAQGHRITEIAAVWVSGGEVRDVWSTLVNPRRAIPSMITRLTGITAEMVATAPPFEAIATELANLLRARVFVAHNAPFDRRFVSWEMEQARARFSPHRQLCTVKLSRKLLPQLPSRSLDALADYFGLGIAARHRAEDDAVATAHLLLRLMDLLEDRGIEDWRGVEVLLGSRAPRRKRQATPRSMDCA